MTRKIQKPLLQKPLMQKYLFNEENAETFTDFSITEQINRLHFRNAYITTPSVYSCAVDCFLEITFRLFSNYLRNISQNSNIFEIIARVSPVYEAAIANSDSELLSQVRQPIWDCILSNCTSFVPRNCDAEFSQIFTGTIFDRLSSEEKLLFSSFYSVMGVCLQCNKNNEYS